MNDSLRNLLDEVLEATSARAKRDDVRPPSASKVSAWPTSVEQVVDLVDADLRAFLATLGTDDLLCVLAEGSPLLRDRVMGQVSESSATWLRANLAMWVPAPASSVRASHEAAIRAAQELVASGRIVRPLTPEAHGRNVDAAQADELAALVAALATLVDTAKANGVAAVSSAIDDADHPLLVEGLQAIGQRADEATLERLLASRRQALEMAHRRSLEAIAQAVMAIHRGEDATAFRARSGGA